MNELRLLVLRRLAALGENGQAMSGREAARRSGGRVSYQTIANIINGSHTGRITDRIAEGLAAALEVPIADIYEAAGTPRPQGRWSLPDRFDRVPLEYRELVQDLIGALLESYSRGYEDGRRHSP